MNWRMAGLRSEIKRNFDGGLLINNQETTLRRTSFALSLPTNLVVDSARRFSNVSDAVSRKISTTIGWRSLSTTIELVVRHGSILCCQYINNRLKRSGIYQRKLGLKRLRRAMISSDSTTIDDVFPTLIVLGVELEKMHPNLFKNVARQVGCRHIANEQIIFDIIIDVSREMLRFGPMTWSKIVALYAVAGGIAVDCVRHDKSEFIPTIQRAMSEVLEEDLATWIQANGGWSALSTRCRIVQQDFTLQEHGIVTIIICSTVFIGFITIILRIII